MLSTYCLNNSGCAKKSAYISRSDRRSSINVGSVTFKKSFLKMS